MPEVMTQPQILDFLWLPVSCPVVTGEGGEEGTSQEKEAQICFLFPLAETHRLSKPQVRTLGSGKGRPQRGLGGGDGGEGVLRNKGASAWSSVGLGLWQRAERRERGGLGTGENMLSSSLSVCA